MHFMAGEVARFLINGRKPAHNRATPGTDRSFTVDCVSTGPAIDGRAPSYSTSL